MDTAKVIGDFSIFIQQTFQVDLKNFTCIGFSLGAHICGMTKMYLGEGKRMGKIIGLDPAGPLFDVNDPTMRLNNDSAEYVECIHTGHYLGIRASICQADFFVNRGSHQPGCTNFLGTDIVTCSHLRAVLYFTETLTNQEAFYGKICDDLKNVLSGSGCSNELGEFMGNDKNRERKVTGIFSVFVINKESPFGRGRQ